jgi:hypothetical protein
MDYLSSNSKSLSRRSSQRSSRSSSPRKSRFSRKSPPKKLNLEEDPPTFQNFDASTKMPDTPMADQFEDDDLESEQSEPELDTERTQLVTHAKVYAIAEKYVPPFVTFPLSPFFLGWYYATACRITFICACRLSFHGCDVVVHCRRFETPTCPAICVTCMKTLRITTHGPLSDLPLLHPLLFVLWSTIARSTNHCL